MIEPKQIALQLGFIFLSAIVCGKLARMMKLPKVAGYLAGGIIIGPGVLGWLNREMIETVKPLTEFALAIVIFEIGTKFQFKRLKKQGKFLLPLMSADILISMVLVFFAVFAVSLDITMAVMLGILSIATAPAATMLVLKEYHAEGDVTDTIISLVGVNNIFCIVLFEIGLSIVLATQGSVKFLPQLGANMLFLGEAVFLGVISGIGISYLEQKVTGAERIILFLGLVVTIFGFSLWIGVSYMMVFLVMGIALVNTSEFSEEIHGELDKIGWPLYVIFFFIAGAKLRIENLKAIGALGIAYLIARAVGKVGGLNLTAILNKNVPSAMRGIGWGLLSQAGLAIGLGMICKQKLRDAGLEIETVIVSTIIIFEIVGSVLVKMTVVKAGEVKIIDLIDRAVANPFALSLRATSRKLLIAMGIGPWEKPGRISSIKTKHIMIKNIKSIQVNANFNDIMHVMAHSRFNNFPVVGETNHYEGMISYPELREVIYDPRLSNIMIAKDFVRMKDVRIDPEMSVNEALELFHRHNLDCLPVVDSESERLLGLVEQREVLRLCGKGRLTH